MSNNSNKSGKKLIDTENISRATRWEESWGEDEKKAKRLRGRNE